MGETVKGLSVVNHVGVIISNLDESVKFCEALTRTKITNRDETGEERMVQAQGSDDTLIEYADVYLEGISIDLLGYAKPESEKAFHSNEQISIMHLCFEVKDIDAAVVCLKAIGVEPDGEPITFQEEDGLKGGFGIGVAYPTDPGGTDLELIAPKGPFTRN